MSKSQERKIQHVWSILASGVSVDQESNNLTLFNIIEQIVIPKSRLIEMPVVGGEKKPAVPVGFIFVSHWRKIKDNVAVKAVVKIELLDPTGVMRQKVEYDLEFAEKTERLRSRVQWNGVRVTTSGSYTFKISLKEEGEKEFQQAGEAYLKVELTDNEQPVGSKAKKQK